MSTQSKQIKVKDVIGAFPEYHFILGKSLSWNASKLSVSYPETDNMEVVYGLIHEVGHAQLEHNSFRHDVELIAMERLAWNKATEIAKTKFGLVIDKEYIEDCLDSYRDWLYKRSLCPKCHLCGFQVNDHEYSCPHCLIDWRVPVSRLCTVKRKILK